MKKLAICALVLAATACQPQAQRSANVVTDAVLVRQNASQVQEDAVRTLIQGTWTCKGVASGINITSTTNYRPGGSFQSTMHMASNQMSLDVGLEGSWVVKGFSMQQAFTSVGNFTGSMNGAPITPSANASLVDAVKQLSTDPEAINLSDHKFTLTDGQGTVTTCTK